MTKKIKKLPALFIGRFQPFHFGHLNAFHQILKREKKVIIAIGSAEKKRSDKNPFSARERYQMIEKVLEKWRDRIIIIPVCDSNDDERWVAYVETLLPPFGTIYTGSSHVKRLFQKDSKHKVISIKKILTPSGTLIRKRMRSGKKWERMVPKKVAEAIKTFQTTYLYGH